MARLGRRRWAALAGGFVVVAATGAMASHAPEAMATRLQHSRVVPYPAEQVWSTAIRYLRVDRGYSVVERDRDAGFILFEFGLGQAASTANDGPKGHGSLELIATADASGRPAVKLQISTDAGPSYLPHAIADGLAAKLKADHGQPAPPPSPPSPRPGPAPTPPPETPDDGPWVPEDPATD